MTRQPNNDANGSSEDDVAVVLCRGPVVVDLNAAADGLLTRWFTEWRSGPNLPGPLSEWLAERVTRRGRAGNGLRPFAVGKPGMQLFVRCIPLADNDVLLVEEVSAESIVDRLEGIGLTRREAQVVARIAEGATIGQSAHHLGISDRTAAKHLQIAYDKLDVHNRAAAANLVNELRAGPRRPG
jgi:DNA-binding CsgD family transcriptional regulator